VIKCFKTAKTTKNTSKKASSSRAITSNGARSKQKSLETLLTEYRTNQSQEEMVPAYCIFSNAVMQSIIAEKPKTRTALLAIHGFGPVKYDKYGEDIIRIIKQATMKSSPKTDTVQITVDMYDEGLSPEQIAEERGLTYQTIHNHLFKAGVVDPRDILSEHEYNDAYILWENSQVDVILEIYGHAGVAAFYFIRNNQLYGFALLCNFPFPCTIQKKHYLCSRKLKITNCDLKQGYKLEVTNCNLKSRSKFEVTNCDIKSWRRALSTLWLQAHVPFWNTWVTMANNATQESNMQILHNTLSKYKPTAIYNLGNAHQRTIAKNAIVQNGSIHHFLFLHGLPNYYIITLLHKKKSRSVVLKQKNINFATW
jgi:hypothetical protein